MPRSGSPTNGSLSGTRLRFSFWRRSDPICATHTVQPVHTRTAECIGADVHESRSASSSSCVVQALCTEPVTSSSSEEEDWASTRRSLLTGRTPLHHGEELFDIDFTVIILIHGCDQLCHLGYEGGLGL